jgi:hypothetical protein
LRWSATPLRWRSIEVERRAAGWRATDWSEEVEADPTVEMEVDLAVRR